MLYKGDLFNEVLALEDKLKDNYSDRSLSKLKEDITMYFGYMTNTLRHDDKNEGMAFVILQNMSHNTRSILDVEDFRRVLNNYFRGYKNFDNIYSYTANKFIKEKVYEYYLADVSNNMQIRKSNKTQMVINKIAYDGDSNKYDDYMKFLSSPTEFKHSLKPLFAFDYYAADGSNNNINTNLDNFYSYYLDKYNKNLNENLDKKYQRFAEMFLTLDNVSIKDFCLDHHIRVDYLKKYLSKLKVCYNSAVIDNELAKKIVDMILNGVSEEDGSKHTFDSLDYYKLTHEPMRELIPFVRKNKDISIEDRNSIIKFINSNKNELLSKSDIRSILKSSTIINVKLDSNGRKISGRVIDEGEKLGILDYLNKENIPITLTTYRDAFNRYKNDKLPIDLESAKSFTLN